MFPRLDPDEKDVFPDFFQKGKKPRKEKGLHIICLIPATMFTKSKEKIFRFTDVPYEKHHHCSSILNLLWHYDLKKYIRKTNKETALFCFLPAPAFILYGVPILLAITSASDTPAAKSTAAKAPSSWLVLHLAVK